MKFINILKTKYNFLKNRFLNTKYIKFLISLYIIFKNFAIKYKLIEPKKESTFDLLKNKFINYVNLNSDKKEITVDFIISSLLKSLIFFIGFFSMFFVAPWLLFILLFGPLGLIILLIIYSVFFFIVESDSENIK